jgi:hypothetical protein
MLMNRSSKPETFIIRDLTGKLVNEIRIEAGQSARITTDGWQNGVYMVIPKEHGSPKNFVISN